ncbi:MAG: translation initiation factor IF-2, partial [Betaproteobacteria bacterium PRO3]|nr:translation initiation factor IF-2 [Betaproteobacteria bacterium PRO3]
MAQTTIEQFATELKMPAGALIEQLAAAGVSAKRAGDNLTEQDKTRLLDYLRKQHGAAGEPKKRITLTRKQTSEIRAPDASGKARTIQVEVRKKRVLVRRDENEAGPAVEEASPPVAEEVPVAEVAPVEAPVVVEPVVEAPAPEAEPEPEAAAPPPAVAPLAPTSVLSAAEIAAREAESKKQQALFARQQEDLKRKQEEAERRKAKAEEAARVAAEAAAKAAAEAEAKAKAPATVKKEGTLHRPAGKPGDRRDKPAKKSTGPVFSEEAARKRALKLRGGDAAATPAGAG